MLAIIQARMASTRLPGKMLADIEGQPMLWHVVNRTKHSSLVDRLIVATSVNSGDDLIFQFCVRNNIECFRGSEDDVLDRFYQAAKATNADSVIRLTGDCPLIDAGLIDKVAHRYTTGDFDYVTNSLRYTYPDGLDVEVFSFKALERAWREAKSPREREHVVSYFKYSGKFKITNVDNPEGIFGQDYRWSVDEPVDLEFVREVYRRLSGRKNFDFGMDEVLNLLYENPEMADINTGISRNEGSFTSYANEPPVPEQVRTLKRSLELKEEASRLIPGYTQTFSKGPLLFIQGVSPVYLSKGLGSHVWDVDQNEYIDYPMALGPVILGHNYPAVTNAVVQQINLGTSFSLAHPLELEVASLLVDQIPCAEMVRFGKNGSDATSGAVRAARAFTGRDIIACCGYHGWQDWYIGTTTRGRGVPEAVSDLTATFTYNNFASLEKIFAENPGQVAAVIMEPIGVEEPEDDFLSKVRELTRREGTVLIYDEVVTGFRLGLGGAQEYFGVIPDLTCVGKAMGNGYPISAVVGSREIMKIFDDVFFSFTFGGEAVSLAASRATIEEIIEKPVIEHLWQQGQRLRDGFNVLAETYNLGHYLECVGLPPHTAISYKDGAEKAGISADIDFLQVKSLFQQECVKRGVLVSSSQNMSFSHSNQDIDYTLRVYRTSMEILSVALKEGDLLSRLEGPLVEPVFRNP